MWSCTRNTWQVSSWGSQGLWMGGEHVSYIPGYQWDEFTFIFSLRIYGKPGKVSYDFFFSFSKLFFLKTILYDPYAKARIVLGWIYFKYQRSIFTYCILGSSWWKIHNCGWLSCREGYVAPLPAWGFYLNMCLFWIMLPQAKLSRFLYFCIESHHWNMWTI